MIQFKWRLATKTSRLGQLDIYNRKKDRKIIQINLLQKSYKTFVNLNKNVLIIIRLMLHCIKQSLKR